MPRTAEPPGPSAAPYPVGVTIEKARATVWPFQPHKGQPMGALVETRQLSLKDLGYAIENAWEERVRKAAIALMLVRLEQAVREPVSSAGALQVVSGGRPYAERRIYLLTLLQGLILGIGLASVVSWLIWSLVRQLSTAPRKPLAEALASPSGIIALVISLVLVVGSIWLSRALLDWVLGSLDRQIESYRQGQAGENQVVDVIRQALDGTWFLFRNIVLPGRSRADLDVVLVGPPGVWVLEVKTFTGEHRNVGEHWEYRAGRRWRLSRASPSRQARDNAVRLSEFLRADDIKQWVTAAVVWASRESPLTVENPATAVWHMDRLPDELGNVWCGEAISEAKRRRIVEKLTRRCQAREEAE